MEANPPSYETAVTRSHWKFVAEYLPSNDLCSALLVCRDWQQIFLPFLWGNPASHFAVENDAVYLALTRFKRSLPWVRLSVRQLTHTLHLPPAHAQMYEGPHADWLRTILERLPRLQSLIVRGLPFFDHGSLLSLQQQPSRRLFELRLLDASGCKNATAAGLAEALRSFPSLAYLDLSWISPAKESAVISRLRYLRSLRILKMRGLSLRDEEMVSLTKAIGLRVRSLDVRNNRLTDGSIEALLRYCFQSSEARTIQLNAHRNTNAAMSDGLPLFIGSELLRVYQGDRFEDHLYKTLTQTFMGRIALEDAAEIGLTHLYLSDNHFSVPCMSEFLESVKLRVIDLGDAVVDPTAAAKRSPMSSRHDRGSGIETLAPALTAHASEFLTYLRINHSIVTKDSAPNDPALETSPERHELIAEPASAELLSDQVPPAELPGESAFQELEATPVYVELPADSEILAESSADTVHQVVSEPKREPHRMSEDEDARIRRTRSLANAPEVCDPHLSPVGTPNSFSNSICSPAEQDEQTTREPRHRRYSSVVAKRRRRLQDRISMPHGLLPVMVPHLRTLVLTGVPLQSSSYAIVDKLIAFLRDCAEETSLSNLEARLDYSLPPGRQDLASAVAERAQEIFALRRLVIELERTDLPHAYRKIASKRWSHTVKSVTEDEDSEALWSAGETDFSFFDDEQSGLAGRDSGWHSFAPVTNGKAVVQTSSPTQASEISPFSQVVDTVEELSAFRKASRSSYESMSDHDITSLHGYWTGEVKLIWPRLEAT